MLPRQFSAASIAPLLGTLILLAACEATTSPTPGAVQVTAVTVSSPSTTVPLGTTVQLSAAVLPSSVSQAVSWSSSDPTRASVNGAGLVTAVLPGTATITATSTLDATKSGTVALTLTGCLPLTQATVSSGATLVSGNCYEAINPLTVTSGVLRVEPGVRIQFAPTASLSATGSGRINATGSAALPILFTSIDPTGVWRGVRFDDSRGTENVLRFVTIERGGSTPWSAVEYTRTALFLAGTSLVDVQNSTIASSGGVGVTVYENAELTFVNNTLRANAVAGWVHPNAARYIDATTSFANNTENVLRVSFGNADGVNTAQTWQRLSVPFEIQTRMFVDAPLTLAAGVMVTALTDVSMIVRNAGAITAIGTAALPISFTTRDAVAGKWKGIQITTNASANRFDYVRFANGGSQAWTGASESRAMVYLDPSSRAQFTNSEFRGSSYYALWVPATGNITGFENNLFTNNARTMIVHPNQAGAIAANNRFEQNTENSVRMTFGNTDAVTVAQRWHDFGVPFKVMDRTFIQAAVGIDAGVEIEFAQNANLIVNEEGSLRADGTVANPVILRGVEDFAGYWKGIEYGTTKAANVLTHVQFRNAGSAAWFGGNDAIATLNIQADGLLTLSNVSFSLTDGYAAIVRRGGVLSCTNIDRNGFMFFHYSNAGNGASASCSL